MRIALGIEYNGSAFNGWQLQKHEPNTIQAVVERAVSTVANETVSVIISGRTDAGVHATGQVAHFDTSAARTAKNWVFGINTQLPKSVVIKWAQVVPEEFHARFSALSRRYRYVIYNNPVRSSIFHGQVSWFAHALDESKMHEAAQHLVGEHNFTSYRSVACQNQEPVKRVDHLRVWRQQNFVVIDIQASGFLMHMVRNIAGVLIKVGLGEQPTDWTKTVLDAEDRTQAAETASPMGLYFVDVGYDSQFDLPRLNIGPLFIADSPSSDFDLQKSRLMDQQIFGKND